MSRRNGSGPRLVPSPSPPTPPQPLLTWDCPRCKQRGRAPIDAQGPPGLLIQCSRCAQLWGIRGFDAQGLQLFPLRVVAALPVQTIDPEREAPKGEDFLERMRALARGEE